MNTCPLRHLLRLPFKCIERHDISRVHDKGGHKCRFGIEQFTEERSISWKSSGQSLITSVALKPHSSDQQAEE